MAIKKDANVPEQEEGKFHLHQLRKCSVELFGVTTSTFDGATANLADGEYSVGEIKQIINNWMKKEAK